MPDPPPEVHSPPPVVALLGAGWLVIGLALLATGPFGFSPSGALAGVVSQLPVTLPAAILVGGATGLNVAAGAVLAWAVRGRPYASAGEAALTGFVGAVILDIVLLGALGGTGTFRWPILALVHVAILAGGHLLRRRRDNQALVDPMPRPAIPAWWPVWIVIGVSWVGLIALQLASPVVPFLDVLPNHVAPVEHLRTFGDFAQLTTTASPIYGPSRTFLGYTALLGVVDTLTTLPAALAVAAFALPGAIFVALGLHRLGSVLGGGRTGTWAVLAFALTTSFVRLPDSRATVLVLPLSTWCLAELAAWMRQPDDRPRAPASAGLLLGAGLAAAILFHPVIGALTAIAFGLAVLARPARAGDPGIPALVTAAVLMLPQVATMTEIAIPTAAALLIVPPGLAAGWLTARSTILRRGLVILGRAAVVATVVATIAFAGTVLPAGSSALGQLLPTIPILVGTSLVGLLVAPRRYMVPVVWGVLLAGVAAATATNLVPSDGTLMTALRFEVPKTLHYWIPIAFVLGAALALDAVWSDDRIPGPIARAALALFLLVAILPLGQAPLTDAYYLGERRVSETVSLQLREAQQGYWVGYPDPRTLIAGDQVGLLGAIRSEIDAGRLGASSGVLHVASSFQQWVAVPLGVFAGVTETDVTPDAEVSIHTVGGRLHPFSDLDSLLAAGYPYVVLEPAGLPASTRSKVVAAGYRSIYANPIGEVFARGS